MALLYNDVSHWLPTSLELDGYDQFLSFTALISVYDSHLADGFDLQ